MPEQPTTALPLRPNRNDRYVFCDESGLHERYFVLGSLWASSDPSSIRIEIESLKALYALNNQIKWERIPKSAGKYLRGYTAVALRFVDSELCYKALIVDTKHYQLNSPEFTGGAYNIGYFQFYLTLLFHGIIRHAPQYNSRIVLHIPAYSLRGGLVTLENKINEAATEVGFPDMTGKSCCRITSLAGGEDVLLQLTDILTGCVSATWNGKLKAKTRIDFVEQISKALKIDIRRSCQSRHEEIRFNRWEFKPKTDPEESKKWPALHPPTK